MALTANELTVMREMTRYKVDHADDATIDQVLQAIRNLTEAQLRTQLKAYATTRAAELQASIDGIQAVKAVYDAVIAG